MNIKEESIQSLGHSLLTRAGPRIGRLGPRLGPQKIFFFKSILGLKKLKFSIFFRKRKIMYRCLLSSVDKKMIFFLNIDSFINEE